MPITVTLTIVRDMETVAEISQFARELGVQLEAAGGVVTTTIAPSAPADPPRGRGRPRGSNNGGAGGNTAAANSGGLADDLNGPVDPDDDDALGLSQPSMTAKEALEQGLGRLREIYAKGHRKEVKDLQGKLGIAKFTDVDEKDGHKLFTLVGELETKLGLRV